VGHPPTGRAGAKGKGQNSVTVRRPVEQTLSSGLTIRQDFRDSVRFVVFETGVDEWKYATHGGTAFVVRFNGRYYGITCSHVRKDFDWSQLAITDRKFGRGLARMSCVYFPSLPEGHAVDSEVVDIAIIEFADVVGAEFFGDTAYIFDKATVGTSRVNDVLLVNGVLKDESNITGERGDKVIPRFALLEFSDRGSTSDDVTIREAVARYSKPEFMRLTGISGSPVFNKSSNKLCGVVVRGTLRGDDAIIRYVDIADVAPMLESVANGTLRANYTKVIARLSTRYKN
jgi:hypothetical protein